MYNLLVTSNADAWLGEAWQIESARCVHVHEYTDAEIAQKYGSLDTPSIDALMKLPCLFAYESFNKLAPKFGFIRDITKRQGQVRIEYEVIPLDPFLTSDSIEGMMFELDIGKWELNRTHWAVKDVNLAKELHRQGIMLPDWVQNVGRAVDISTHSFEVGLSFPGEVRQLVEDVARQLEGLIGPNAYFYDNNYVAQLARPSLDILLQDIYRNRSKLIVVFLSADYQNKNWCGIELRAIRDIIAEREHQRIMFIRTDDGAVEGVFATDGYVDARNHDATALARFIQERVQLL